MTGNHVGALTVHIFAVAVFHGLLALALGAWTGSTGVASGVTAGVLAVSFFAVGLLPMIEGAADLARLFPWYYLDASGPVVNGVDAGHVAILLGGSAVALGAAVVGVNRRDLRQPTVGSSLLDRVAGNPLVQRLLDRLGGSVRVSRIWVKTATDHQTVTVISALTMFWMMGVMMGPIYATIDDAIAGVVADMPDVLLALVGNGDMTTAAGYFQVETFSMMAPAAIMAVTITVGARALAGEEDRRTMGLLLANPITRSRVVLEKSVSMVILAGVVGVSTFAGVMAGSAISSLGLDPGNVAATSLLATLLSLLFGAVALALSAATGRVRTAVTGAVGLAFAMYLLDSFLPLSDDLARFAAWSPFHYYLRSDPLNTGMDWGDGALLTALFAVLVAASTALFGRRDLRQG